MLRPMCAVIVLASIAGKASAQDFYGDVGAGGYLGAGSVGSQEPLYPYDDQEPWKHGYLQIVPYYGGYHSGRPYNYHHVFAQTQTSVGWGMPHGLPYSQQWYNRFDTMGDPGRSISEPNGYFGYTPAPQTGSQWAQLGPIQSPPMTGPIAPVQYQQPMVAPGVDPRMAPIQTQQLRQYLAAPGGFAR